MLSLPYIAGLFDSEGWISVVKDSHQTKRNKTRWEPSLAIANTDKHVMVELLETLTNNNVTCCYLVEQRRQNKCHRTLYQVRCTGFKGVKRFCDLILPYTVSKRVLVTLILGWYDYRKSLPYSAPQSDFEDYMARKIKELGSDPTHRLGFLDVDRYLPFAEQWLAGYFDGDGNINMYLRAQNPGHKRRIYTLRCSFGSVSKDTIEFIYKLLLRKGVKCHLKVDRRSLRKPSWRDLYSVAIDNIPNVKSFINLIQPYVIIKRAQLEVASEWIKYREQLADKYNGNKHMMSHTEIDESYYLRMRELNTRGVSNND